MKSAPIALALAVLALLVLPASLAAQGDTKTARGSVSIIGDDTLTIKMEGHDMKFVVDSKTTVEAVGGSTKTRQAQAAGQAGPKLSEVLKVGQPVQVAYTESAGTMKAVSIRAVSSVGSSSDTKAAAGETKTASGTVKSVAPTSLTMTGSGAAATTQTFTIDSSTKVIGRGVGTAAAAAGGRTVVTDLVAVGDTVSITYHSMGNAMHAAEIRVTAKAPK
jgi:hypothetical protein